MKKSLQHCPIQTLFNFLPQFMMNHLPLHHLPQLLLDLNLSLNPTPNLLPMLKLLLQIILQQLIHPVLHQSQHFDYSLGSPPIIFAGTLPPELLLTQ
jgi:hypothetical protein